MPDEKAKLPFEEAKPAFEQAKPAFEEAKPAFEEARCPVKGDGLPAPTGNSSTHAFTLSRHSNRLTISQLL